MPQSYNENLFIRNEGRILSDSQSVCSLREDNFVVGDVESVAGRIFTETYGPLVIALSASPYVLKPSATDSDYRQLATDVPPPPTRRRKA